MIPVRLEVASGRARSLHQALGEAARSLQEADLDGPSDGLREAIARIRGPDPAPLEAQEALRRVARRLGLD